MIDLEMRKSIGSTNLGEEVTILQKGDPLSPYVFLGTENGNVIVVHALQDVRTVAVSNYSVNYSVCSGGSQALGFLFFLFFVFCFFFFVFFFVFCFFFVFYFLFFFIFVFVCLFFCKFQNWNVFFLFF